MSWIRLVQKRLIAILCLLAASALTISSALAQEEEQATKPSASPDPYKDIYKGYVPDFIQKINSSGYGHPLRGWKREEEEMKLSSEPLFFTLSTIAEDSRANALVEAGLKKEEQGQYREALKIYQQIIEKYPGEMYRVSDYGVFVPVGQYCQRRILKFPANELEFYRTLHDARAKESFEQARRQYSLLGMSDVAEGALATSYGGRAILELGDAALDSGYYLAALERYTTVRDFFPDKDLLVPELYLKIAYCQKMLGGNTRVATSPVSTGGKIDSEQLKQLEQVIKSSKVDLPEYHRQQASPPLKATDDYGPQLPTQDPLGLQQSVWSFTLPGSRRDLFVYTQPVVTDNSVIYRHKNIVYARSILNGEIRWQNDLGGRAQWQNVSERQYPQEDVLVQDGLVFATINKAGPSLVAIDEVTGQIRWAYGPMVASNVEESRMRFEAAPAGGPKTVYAGYILDNIEGDTHTDSEYGVIAFESTTGRIQWKNSLSRLAPGKFSGGFAEKRRNRIRSFTSPPLYHEGTVYYCTNAGTMAALDALSGRVKWLSRYPYYPEIHDATRQFGGLHHYGPNRPHTPMFWYNQRPLMVGESMIVMPVDSRMMHCVDRRTGKTLWTKYKGVRQERNSFPAGGCVYVLGLASSGELVMVYSHRGHPVHLVDMKTGESNWVSPTHIAHEDQPILKHQSFTPYGWAPAGINNVWYCCSARPLLTTDDKLHIPSHARIKTGSYGLTIGWSYHLGGFDLKTKQKLPERRYITGEVMAIADYYISKLIPEHLKNMEDVPAKDEKLKESIRQAKEVIADSVPVNPEGPFMPYTRLTFERYGQPFELRFGPRQLEMVYDRDAVNKAIGSQNDLASTFARAELAVASADLHEAAGLLNRCLDQISSEDLDFRASINQQLYRVYQRLARRSISANNVQEELKNCLGMSRNVSTLAEEMETLLAISEAFTRTGEYEKAGNALRTIISTYGHHELPINSLVLANYSKVTESANSVLKDYQTLAGGTLYNNEFSRSIHLMQKGMPLYFSTVSPLPKTMTVRTGEFAARRLIALQKEHPEFQQKLSQIAEKELQGEPSLLMERLWEFPATPAAQSILERLLAEAAKDNTAEGRKLMWKLADVARVSALTIPEDFRQQVVAQSFAGFRESLEIPQTPRAHEFQDTEGATRLVLERQGDRSVAPNILFIGGRVKKRLDNKFILTARDLETGDSLWETAELRLKGRGQEAGFSSAFVYKDLVIVHGLYDVLAFTHADGKLVWRYRVPFDFEIRSALLSGDMLILSGSTETISLFVESSSPNGEVVWQAKELGDIYTPPYVRGDRIISVRKLPYSVTIRYRATGRLIGRLDLPDLSQNTKHPLFEKGHQELPTIHHENLLVVTDGWYYLMIDTDRMAVKWKRLIDSNDVTTDPAMRFALSNDYFSVTKNDYDQKTIYMLSTKTGEILWHTDPKDANSPQALYSMVIDGNNIYGAALHPGQGFYFVGRDCKTGKKLFQKEVAGFAAKPEMSFMNKVFDGHLVAQVAMRQQFLLIAYELATGKEVLKLERQGIGPFGEPGRVSATVQNGRLVLLTKEKLAQ